MHFLENRLLGALLGTELRAAAFELYWRRNEASPDFGVISVETGISLDALHSAWEIVRSESLESKGEVV